jgi:hypothetical protein
MWADFTEFLQYLSQEKLLDNEREILISVDKRSKDVINKIESFRNDKLTENERSSISVEDIVESIKTNPLVRAMFRKDTTRQNTHEDAQIEWIKMYKYPDAEKMKTGTGGMYISNNKLHKVVGRGERPSDATKTLDMIAPLQKVYGILKHTSQEGGAQDNQYADVKHFVNQIVGYLSENLNIEEVFEFYLDGEYYNEKRRKELLSMIPEDLSSKIIITSCETIKPLS